MCSRPEDDVMRLPSPLTVDAFRAALDEYASAELADVDATMDLGHRAAAHPWADDALADWLDAQPATEQVIDVATGVLLGFGLAKKDAPTRVVDPLVRRARDLGAVRLGQAANNVAFVAARVLRQPATATAHELRQAARELLEDLLAHADRESLQSVARDAARDALTRDPRG
jgi:hypothetical protein